MPLTYRIIEIFTSEEARFGGRPLYDAVVEFVSRSKIAARCIVTRGIAGSYENGEIASTNIEVLLFNMPIKIEIILPSAELDTILPKIEEMVRNGIVAIREVEAGLHRAQSRLIPRQLKVKDAMTPRPKSVSTVTSVSEIIRLLLNSDFNTVPVVDSENRPVGIITQEDLIKRAEMPIRLGLLAKFEQEQIDAYLETVANKTAGEIMTSPAITVSEDKRLGDAVDLMLKHHLKRFPVVDDRGVLTGILARFDVFRTITREVPDWEAIKAQQVAVEDVKTVADVMRRDTQTVKPNALIEEVIRIIDTNDIQRVAVVDDEEHLLGLISDADLVSAFSEHRAGLWDHLVRKLPFAELARRHEELIERTQARTASDVMKTDLITVCEDTSVDEAVKLMAENGIKRLPVIDDNGIFKGLISRDSLLRAGI